MENRDRTSRIIDILWNVGLGCALASLLGTAVGIAPGLLRAIAWVGLGLSVLSGALAFRHRKFSMGVLLALGACVFTLLVGWRLARARTGPANGAASSHAETAQPGPEHAASGDPSSRPPFDEEVMNHPGPVALSASGFTPVPSGALRPSILVLAPSANAWYAARVVSVRGARVLVHFIGWESEWDEEIPVGQLHLLGESQMPPSGFLVPANTVGRTKPLPCALIVFVFSPASGHTADQDLKSLTPAATLFAKRLDVTDAPLSAAIPAGLSDGDGPFALAVEGAVRIDAKGAYRFAVESDGPAALSVDGAPVDAAAPVELSAGVHAVRLEYRHASGSKMTLGLRMGREGEALRVLDMNRQGAAQVAREPDGSLRLLLAESVLFDLDQATLTPSARRALASIRTPLLSPAPGTHIRVEGHTDDRGSNAHNLALSRRRAERVRHWLIEQGRAPESISVEAFGETRPRVPNDSESNRAANRRVELVIASATGH